VVFLGLRPSRSRAIASTSITSATTMILPADLQASAVKASCRSGSARPIEAARLALSKRLGSPYRSGRFKH